MRMPQRRRDAATPQAFARRCVLRCAMLPTSPTAVDIRRGVDSRAYQPSHQTFQSRRFIAIAWRRYTDTTRNIVCRRPDAPPQTVTRPDADFSDDESRCRRHHGLSRRHGRRRDACSMSRQTCREEAQRYAASPRMRSIDYAERHAPQKMSRPCRADAVRDSSHHADTVPRQARAPFYERHDVADFFRGARGRESSRSDFEHAPAADAVSASSRGTMSSHVMPHHRCASVAVLKQPSRAEAAGATRQKCFERNAHRRRMPLRRTRKRRHGTRRCRCASAVASADAMFECAAAYRQPRRSVDVAPQRALRRAAHAADARRIFHAVLRLSRRAAEMAARAAERAPLRADECLITPF